MNHDPSVLRELVVLAGISLAVVLLLQRMRLPAMIGFIATGVVVGPGGLGLVGDTALVQTLAELGVVLLLFMVGLEFSLADLRRLSRLALTAGTLQVVLTVGVVAGALMAFGMPAARAVFFGMLVSLSSTAVVLKMLTDRLELAAPHGRLATGVLIFQDLAAILFLLATPMLARTMRGGDVGPVGGGGLGAVLRPLAWLVAAGLVLWIAKRAVPWLLGHAFRGGSREAFLFSVALVSLGAAYLTSRMGASLALGAFVAGLILADSELRSQIAADVLPFRDTLASLFFVAIGMSLDVGVLVRHPGLIAASTAGLVVAKLLLAVVAFRLARRPWRVGFASAVALAQVGEFSFVVAQAGAPLGLLGNLGGQAFTAGAVFSLILTPFLVAAGPRWALALDMRIPGWLRGSARGWEDGAATADVARSELMSDHVVIAGAGLNGRNVARVLRSVRLPHLVVDLAPESAHMVQADGSRVLLGDMTHPLTQKEAGVSRARVVVLAISDPSATRYACRIARGLSSKASIVVRTRSVNEIDELYALGADQVIPEEFETSIEIFTSVLQRFHVPTNVIEGQILLLRQERYSLLRGRKLPGSVLEQLENILREGLTDTFLLLQRSPAVGHTLVELGLLDEDGARVVAVVRHGEAITRFEKGFRLEVGDTLVLTGAHAEMERAFRLLS